MFDRAECAPRRIESFPHVSLAALTSLTTLLAEARRNGAAEGPASPNTPDAVSMVPVAKPNSLASARADGMRSSGASRPSAMALRNRAQICRYKGSNGSRVELGNIACLRVNHGLVDMTIYGPVGYGIASQY